MAKRKKVDAILGSLVKEAVGSPERKRPKYPGVFLFEGKKGPSFRIDYIHPQTGERVQKRLKGVKSEAQAAEIRSIEIADATRGAIQKAYGIKAKPQTVSFESMLAVYLSWAKENKKSGLTDEFRSRALEKFFKGKLMSDITPFMVEEYKVARVGMVNKKTVNKEIVLGSQIFLKAFEWEKYGGENPFRKVSRFKVSKGKKPGALTLKQVKMIRDEIKHPVKRDMVDFDFHAGWRIGEIRKLKWDDLNLERSKAWIIDPKNGESVEIDLATKAVEILSRQKKRGPFVFCHLNGKPYKTNLHTVIKNAAERAGVPLPHRKAWHILRRTWTSNFLQSGGDVETLRVLGNWKDYQMPLWYAEAPGSERRKEILDRIPDLDFDGTN